MRILPLKSTQSTQKPAFGAYWNVTQSGKDYINLCKASGCSNNEIQDTFNKIDENLNKNMTLSICKVEKNSYGGMYVTGCVSEGKFANEFSFEQACSSREDEPPQDGLNELIAGAVSAAKNINLSKKGLKTSIAEFLKHSSREKAEPTENMVLPVKNVTLVSEDNSVTSKDATQVTQDAKTKPAETPSLTEEQIKQIGYKKFNKALVGTYDEKFKNILEIEELTYDEKFEAIANYYEDDYYPRVILTKRLEHHRVTDGLQKAPYNSDFYLEPKSGEYVHWTRLPGVNWVRCGGAANYRYSCFSHPTAPELAWSARNYAYVPANRIWMTDPPSIHIDEGCDQF